MSEQEIDELDYQVKKYHWVSGESPDTPDEHLELLIDDEDWTPETGIEHLGRFCHKPEYHGAIWLITDETDLIEMADFGMMPSKWVGETSAERLGSR